MTSAPRHRLLRRVPVLRRSHSPELQVRYGRIAFGLGPLVEINPVAVRARAVRLAARDQGESTDDPAPTRI
jgi:hypothetical protein